MEKRLKKGETNKMHTFQIKYARNHDNRRYQHAKKIMEIFYN
jgi:hypothetical protein